ncbi:MAG: hypothetical protein P8Z37_14545 [Acidobacteriota bacterium]|jgi:hypothetical protein
MFGLPFSTTFVAFGVPFLIVLALVWWGVRFPVYDTEEPETQEDLEP